MNNLLDNLIQALGRNKKNLIFAIITYIIISLLVIGIIWWPEKKEYLEYENIKIENKQKELAQAYINEISLLFKTGDKEAIKSLISNEYIEYIGKSSNEIINELEEKGFFSLYLEIKGIDLYVDGNTYVYTTKIYYKNATKSINIIENYPYKYELVFDDFYKYNVVEQSSTNQNIKFTIKDVYKNLKYIEFNLMIENLNSSYIRLDFNSPTCVQAVLTDGRKYTVSNLISTSSYTEVDSNTTISKNFVFEIPANLQNKIEYIIFNGVILDFSTLDIKVKI